MDPVLIDQQRMRGSANNPGMTNWLRDYGIDVGTDLVMDFEAHETLGFQTQYGAVSLPYPYWPQVPTSDNQNAKAISGGSQGAVFPWASSIEVTNRFSDEVRDVRDHPAPDDVPHGGARPRLRRPVAEIAQNRTSSAARS